MSKFRLKDRELQAKFTAIYPNFEDALNKDVSAQAHDSFDYIILTVKTECHGLSDEIHLFKSDIEPVPEYDHHGWNELSDVRPPELGVYRVEVFENADDSEPELKRAGYWDGRRFHVEKYGARIRFRPWEDENE